MAKPNTFTDAAKRKYLRGLTRHGNVEAACRCAKTTRVTVMHHRDSDEVFAKSEVLAWEAHRDAIDAEVKRRAIDGVLEPVFYQGNVCKTKLRRFSDTLLHIYAKRHNPAYRDRSSVDLTVAGGVLVIGGEKNAEDWASTKNERPEDTGDPGD